MNVKHTETKVYSQSFRSESKSGIISVHIDDDDQIRVDPVLFHYLDKRVTKEDLRDLGIFFTEVYRELMK